MEVLKCSHGGEIAEVKVESGSTLSYGKVLMILNPGKMKIKAKKSGKIVTIFKKVGDWVEKGENLLSFTSGCTHPTIMKDMCAECGKDLREEIQEAAAKKANNGNNEHTSGSSAGVAMVHSIPELKVSDQEAQNLGEEDQKRLLKDRKLVLLVDLDQTVIHTTNENIAPNIKDVYHFQLYGPNSPWYHTRIRPRTMDFLESISKMFELHITTFGARMYAHTITGFLDPDSKYFSHRILSRDECFNSRSKTANLSALFPCGDHMVCIIDDREDVWNFARNMVHVKPYHFFKNTGDINAPPGSKDSIQPRKKNAKDNKTPKYKPTVVEKTKKTSKGKPSESKDDGEDEPSKEEIDPRYLERRESIDMPALDDDDEAEQKKEDDKKEVADDISMVSDDLELSDDDNSNQGTETKKEKDRISDLDSDEEEEEEEEKKKVEDDLIEMEDHDDYLLYLEEILKTIHKAYYDLYDQMQDQQKDKKVPDLKNVIPYVKRKALQGTNIVFSGVVPTHIKTEKSKAYMVAKSLGATISDKLDSTTTHLIAARPGTAKVNESKKIKGLFVVTPDWLWCSAERWEKVDERLFPLTKSGTVTLKPPAHCSSPEIAFAERCANMAELDGNASTPERELPETMNPFLAMSSEDLQGMDKEIDDILSGESSSDSEYDEPTSSSLSKKRKRSDEDDESNNKSGKFDEDDEEELPEAQDLDDEEETQDGNYGDDDDDDECNETGGWDSMGAELEREFLGDNNSFL